MARSLLSIDAFILVSKGATPHTSTYAALCCPFPKEMNFCFSICVEHKARLSTRRQFATAKFASAKQFTSAISDFFENTSLLQFM
ncbi:hypothetical protein EV702DRAFT_1054029 [Suillus placidus]|uniref:Uncharacterized protein n=1 Tax=Suillus placidus TaxID=48579 RepID=A0A9P7D9I2_9AGAM|nr:hypothetical protein EV702DRAFT_1054029 [Suillus placidus]